MQYASAEQAGSEGWPPIEMIIVSLHGLPEHMLVTPQSPTRLGSGPAWVSAALLSAPTVPNGWAAASAALLKTPSAPHTLMTQRLMTTRRFAPVFITAPHRRGIDVVRRVKRLLAPSMPQPRVSRHAAPPGPNPSGYRADAYHPLPADAISAYA
jgi:hypothetical protein